MQRFQNTIGNARHGLERMTPNGFMSRQHVDVPMTHPSKRAMPPGPLTPGVPGDGKAHLSFDVPFSSTLAGPEPSEVLHASPDALRRWTFPVNAAEELPIYQLPVHSENVESLRRVCRILSDNSGGRMEAIVKSSEPKNRRSQGLLTNVCISGDSEAVLTVKQRILHETPILLVLRYSFSRPEELLTSIEIRSRTYRHPPCSCSSIQRHSSGRFASYRYHCQIHWDRCIPYQPKER